MQAIVLEVQLRGDPRKRLTWPAYVVNQRQRLDVPTCLIVVTPDAAVARWAAEAIETGHPGFVMTPLVLGPSTLPVVKDVESARRAPEAAVLSVMAHGKGEDGLRIAQVVLKAIDGLDDERKLLYADISFLSVNEAARRALEAMMKGGYEYQSDFAKTYFGQGRAEGRAQEGAFAVLAVLDARGIEVLEAVRQRVLGCKDVETLESWLRRAAVVPKASDIFAESKNS